MHIPLRGRFESLTIGCEHEEGKTVIMDVVATERGVNNVLFYQLRCPECKRTVAITLERL